MKRSIVLAAAVLALAGLTGCDYGAESASADDARNEALHSVTQDQAITELRQGTTYFDATVSDDLIIELMEAACGYLDRGETIEAAVSLAVDNGMEPGDAGAFIAATVASSCIDHYDDVQAYIDRWLPES